MGEMITSFDGMKLYLNKEVPKNRKAVAVIVHGLCEHQGRYDYLAGIFHDAGIGTYRFDHRGHGRSEGERTYYSDFNQLLDDTNVVVDMAIAENPDYAKVVCRCEMVTEAEIRDAIRRPLGARSVSEVKLRTRAGMGRCQGGFCGPRVVEILCEELGLSPLEVTQCGGDSQILVRQACSGEGLE